MTHWTAFPYDGSAYAYSPAALVQHWARLHAGDAEPLPDSAQVLAAWALFHAGEFKKAFDAGIEAGGAGITVANKAQAIHANYLEKSAKTKLAMLAQVIERAQAQAAAEPKNANAHFWVAYALRRYSQGISLVHALSQGLGHRVRQALETAVELEPTHADAHVALGCFHAEAVDRHGKRLSRGQGADAAMGLKMFSQALRLNPASAISMVESANGLVMLEGHKRLVEAEQLYARAAACQPMDATEHLDVEMAKAELEH
jgi:tetratricopeptide (TPR) repeat protein